MASTIGGVMYMHYFAKGGTLLNLDLGRILYIMFVWWVIMWCYMWIYLQRTSYICGPIKIVLWYDFVYYLWIHVLFIILLGFLPFLFGTYGRNWSYMASQKNWCVKSLGNSIFKYLIFTFIWSYHNLGSSCYVSWIQKASCLHFNNYQAIVKLSEKLCAYLL